MARGSDADDLLTGEEIRGLLTALGDGLADRGLSGELFVVGGAALALAYARDETTRDIDALFEPKAPVLEIAEAMAADHGLRPGWLNDGVKGFLHGEDADRRLVIDHPALAVWVASPRYSSSASSGM